jgi:guanylate kinase
MDKLTGVERLAQQTTGVVPRLLFILSGPSGVGKNSIIKQVLANHPMYMDRVRTYTTREQREGEVDGEQYHFVSKEEFRRLAVEGRLMEADKESVGHDVYGLGKVYSMPSDLFGEVKAGAHLVVAEVDVHGMRLLKSRYPGSIAIFITATPGDLAERIESRVDDHMSSDALAQRLDTAREQIGMADEFDYIVVNREDRLEEAVEAVEAIIAAERMRVRPGISLSQAEPDGSLSSAV